jgi:hypothetical protein
VIDHTLSNWVLHPSQDLAAAPIYLTPERHHHSFFMTDFLLTKEVMERLKVGPGDDTFLVGRFVYADGGVRNHPSVRFGQIAMNPGEPLKTGDGRSQESFLVETHSIGGYSGSPVFVLFHPNALRATDDGTGFLTPDKARGEQMVHLLGVDWGHLPTKWTPIKKRNGEEHLEGWGIQQNSGMMGVVPAWYVQELLDMDELAGPRNQTDQQAIAMQESNAILDAAEEQSPPFTQTDFENALKTVSRRIQPSRSDEEK